MKAILLLSLVLLSTLSQAQNSEILDNGKTVAGLVIKGSTTAFDKQGSVDGERVYIVNMDLLKLPVKQAVKLYHNAPDGIPTQWVFTRNDVVRIGHKSLDRRMVIMPSWSYGIDYACDVSGSLIIDKDDGKLYTHGEGIRFTYEDPYTRKKTVDILTMVATFDPTSSRDDRRYQITCVVKDEPYTPFCGYIFGNITQFKTDMYAESGLTYAGNYHRYKIYAEDTTKPQVINYMNWWVNCVLPSL